MTPNSFSDPKKYLNEDLLLQTINKYINQKNIVFDFGFESTAPMNSSITLQEEKERFDHCFSLLKKCQFDDKWISLDTYKIENFRYFQSQLHSQFKNIGIIFNDVSGVIDQDLLSLLCENKNNSKFYYVFNNTLIKNRSDVLDHMLMVKQEDDSIEAGVARIEYAYNLFKAQSIHEKIIFDPGFGFSKTYEQNWKMINHFSIFIERLNDLEIANPLLIGLSKKSFLRQYLKEKGENSSDLFKASEALHARLISQLMSSAKQRRNQLIFRVHDFEIVTRAFESVES